MSERRRPGRPRVLARLQPVRSQIPPDDYDALCRIALRHDRTLSAVVRAAIRKLLSDERGGCIHA